VAIASGVILWGRRESLAPYPAMQLLLLACGVSGAVAIIAALCMAPNLLGTVMLTPLTSLLFLLMFPAMMVWFHFLESGARRAA